MDCDAVRNVLSAQLDHEAAPTEAAAAEAHLGRCGACRAWWVEISRLTRVLKVRVAEPIPDIATPVLARVQPVSAGRGQWVRFALALVTFCELALAVPRVLAGDGATSIHDARHLGSFGAAVSIGLLYVAWRPARAFGILPIIAALALTMTVTAAVDIARGNISAIEDAHHLLEVTAFVLVWMLAGCPKPRRPNHLIDASHPAPRLRRA